MQKYAALILASRDIGEVDRIYILYTREAGLVKAIGRGVRKPAAKLAGHLEPGTLSEVYVARARGIGQITGAITIADFENIKKDFGKLGKVLKIFRFFARCFSEEEKDERVFDLLVDFLTRVGLSSESMLLTEAFWWKLFDALGHRPETMKCAKCGGKIEAGREKYFSAARGGVVCEKCPAGESGLARISSDQIKLLRIFLANPLGKILKVKVDERELEKSGKIREGFRKYNF